MKKGIVLFSVFLLSCTNLDVKNDLQKLKLNGNVKTLLVNCYTITFEDGKIIKEKNNIDDSDNPDADNKCTFNESGFILSKSTPYKDIDYSYDKNDKLVKIITEGDTVNYKYNSNGYVTTERKHDLYEKYFLTKVKYYDLKANLVKEIHFNESDKNNLIMDSKYEYDEFNNVIKIDDRKIYKNQYDDKGNLTAKNLYYRNENNILEKDLIETYHFKYDNNSNLTDVSNFDDSNYKIHNKENIRITYRYDENSNVIETKKNTFYFLINENRKDIYEDSKYTFEYEYDSHQNWIVKKIYLNDILINSIERKITYY
ncbi:hypothetical protein [Flavobacterium sp. H122]|uniref:hypothetical protein n=1 Tax=Flavobacterium sp. H122 TaxID=2529860 RepID=UPI0010AA2B1A|nr:hypothetical protein [Flavobacterium sp. H122]